MFGLGAMDGFPCGGGRVHLEHVGEALGAGGGKFLSIARRIAAVPRQGAAIQVNACGRERG